MARIEWVEARLVEWGEWARSGGRSDLGTGYPIRNVLHEDWGRPGQGVTPTPKVVLPGQGSATHEAVCQLSDAQQQALVLVYWEGLTSAAIAARLKKAPATIDQRIWSAHGRLQHMLARRTMARGGVLRNMESG